MFISRIILFAFKNWNIALRFRVQCVSAFMDDTKICPIKFFGYHSTLNMQVTIRRGELQLTVHV